MKSGSQVKEPERRREIPLNLGEQQGLGCGKNVNNCWASGLGVGWRVALVKQCTRPGRTCRQEDAGTG